MEIKIFILLVSFINILIFLAKCKQLENGQKKILFYIQEYEHRKDLRESIEAIIKKEQSLNTYQYFSKSGNRIEISISN